MKRSRFSEEQIAYALRLAESGTPVVDVCRQIPMSDGSPIGMVPPCCTSTGCTNAASQSAVLVLIIKLQPVNRCLAARGRSSDNWRLQRHSESIGFASL